MNKKPQVSYNPRKIMMLIIAAVWLITLTASLIWNIIQDNISTESLALAEAKASYSKDLVYRRWAAMHGGVYVPVTEKTLPNKYLTGIPERDITTESGRKLTLINPAYMTRQVHELGDNQYGIRGHITSLKPIRPENKADDWEKIALLAFEKGSKEQNGFEMIDGNLYLRFMRPMITEASCLKCHASQGYKEGEIRGGISVSVPYAPYAEAVKKTRKSLILSHALIGLLGLLGLGISNVLLNKTEKSLKENEERYRVIFEYSRDATVTLQYSSFKLFSANRAAYELFNLDEKTDIKMLSPDDLSPAMQPDGRYSSEKSAEMVRIAMEKGHHIFEWRHKRLNGEEFPAIVQLTKMKIKGHKFLHAIIRDISAQKEAEEALQSMANRLKAISDNLPDVMIYQLEISPDRSRRFTYLSAGVELIHGISAEEGLKDPSLIYATIHEDDIKMLAEAEEYAIENKSEFKMESRIRQKNGGIRWVLLNSAPRLLAEGKIVFDGVEIDITKLKFAEESLRKSQERLKEAQRIAHIGNWELDIVNNILTWSEEIYKIFEIEPKIFNVSYENFLDTIHPEDKEAVNLAYSESLINKTLYEIDHRLLMPDGRIKYVHESCESYYDLNGNPLRSVGTVQDITAARLADIEKEKLRDQLLQAQKIESVGRLAGGVAHDFNNMLGVIIGHTELIMNEVKTDDTLHDELNEILTAAQRSADLTKQLLAFARKQTAAPKILNLNDTVSGMLKMLRRLIGEDINLNWMPGSDLWKVKMDPAQIDQILANLLVNARDALSGSGNISISTKNIILDEFYCKERPEYIPGEYVLISVSDDGAGMDKDVREQIFEPFFTTKGIGLGTGLGLATVYGIVRQNDGYINVYSEKNIGTTFMIYLPKKTDEDAMPQIITKRKIPRGKGETVLLVEDEPSFLRLGKNMLVQLGYTALTSENPSEAVRISESHEGHIDLLITDVVMPNMNGKDLAAEIQKIEPGVKILFMSGYTADIIAHRGIIDENVNFIQKPFSLTELANKISKILNTECE